MAQGEGSTPSLHPRAVLFPRSGCWKAMFTLVLAAPTFLGVTRSLGTPLLSSGAARSQASCASSGHWPLMLEEVREAGLQGGFSLSAGAPEALPSARLLQNPRPGALFPR